MINDNFIDRLIGKKLLEQNKEEQENHKSSGKLSAGMLGQPLQWQILKHYGVPTKDFDEYTLRKFLRGKEIEKWLLEQIPNKIIDDPKKQKFAEYRGVIGYIDAIVDTRDWDFNVGIIPVEIKSTSNAKYKRICQESQADKGHCLQAGLYALSEKSEHFAISYVATDDLRVKTYLFKTEKIKSDIDFRITRYEEQLKKGVPVFEYEEKWQANPLYNNYPDWSALGQEELNEKIKPYNKL